MWEKTTRVRVGRAISCLIKQRETYEEQNASTRIMQGQVVSGYPILESPWLRSCLKILSYFSTRVNYI